MSFYGLTDKSSLMDLSEFRGIPTELKQVYVQQFVNKIAATGSRLIAEDWNKLSPTDKAKWKTQASIGADNVVRTMIEKKAAAQPPMVSSNAPTTTPTMGKISSYMPFGSSGYSVFDPRILESVGI